MDNMGSKPRKPSLRSVLHGAFVLFQLIYLPLSNLLQFVPRELPPQSGEFDIRKQREGTATNVRPIQDAIDRFGTFIDRYGELSGQTQYWSLFAPDFGRQTVFPVVEFVIGDDEVYTMRCDPHLLRADPARYLRWPGPDSRKLGYEFLLSVVYWDFSGHSLREQGPAWRDAILHTVRNQNRSLAAYFRCSVATLKRAHPDLPEVHFGVLRVWIQPSPRPGENQPPPAFMMPLARWHPQNKDRPLEAYDPVAGEFIALDRE